MLNQTQTKTDKKTAPCLVSSLPMQFAKENSRMLQKGLTDLRLFQPPDIVSLEAAVQNFRT